MDWKELRKPENQNPLQACRLALVVINKMHRAFGAPGDYGYETRKGDALRCLYEATWPLTAAVEHLEAAEREQQADADSVRPDHTAEAGRAAGP